MRSTHHGTQPCLAFCHRRVPDRRRVYPRLEKLLRKLERLRRISNMDWNNRGLANLKLKSALLQLALEKFRVRPQLLDQPLAFRRIQQSKGSLASRGRRAVGQEVVGEHEIFDQPLAFRRIQQSKGSLASRGS